MWSGLKRLIPDKQYNRHAVLLCYSFIIFNCGSIFYGWNGFIGLLYKAGTFEEFCDGSTDRKFASFTHGYSIDCSERQFQISNLSSLAVTTHIMSSPISGIMTDFIGQKAWYVVGQTFYVVAWILFALMPKNMNAMRASFFIMGFAAEAQIMPLISICKLYPENEFLVISIIGALRSLSFIVPTLLYLIFSLSYFEPADINKICSIYIIASIVPSILLGLVAIPWNIHSDEEIDDVKRIDDVKTKPTMGERLEKFGNFLLKLIKSPYMFEFILVCLCIFTQMARTDILNKAQRELFTVSTGQSAVTASAYALVLSFIPCPMFGYISDKYTPPVAFIIVQFFASISIIFVIFDNIVTKYISIIGYFFSSSFFISSIYSFITWRFDRKHFGVISGAMFVVIGTLLITNYILMKVATDDAFGWGSRRYEAIPYLCFIHCILGMICAIVLYFITRKPKPKQEIAIP